MAYITPNPDNLNQQRAFAASQTLVHFSRTAMGETMDGTMRGEDFDLRQQNLTDLLCDLAHFCDGLELNLAECLRNAQSNYLAETDNKGRQRFDASTPALRAIEPKPLTCPHCKSGQIQEVRDASVTRMVIGSRMTGPNNNWPEAILSEDDDVNTYDDNRLCCNECDHDFYEDDIAEIADGAYTADVDDADATCECGRPTQQCAVAHGSAPHAAAETPQPFTTSPAQRSNSHDSTSHHHTEPDHPRGMGSGPETVPAPAQLLRMHSR